MGSDDKNTKATAPSGLADVCGILTLLGIIGLIACFLWGLVVLLADGNIGTPGKGLCVSFAMLMIGYFGMALCNKE